MPQEPAPFATDQRKNPPPSGWLDRVLRRFARASYGAAVLLLYVLAATALGLALAPALWMTNHLLFFAKDHAAAWGALTAWALRGFAGPSPGSSSASR